MAERAPDSEQAASVMAWLGAASSAFVLHVLLLPGMRGTFAGISESIDSLSFLAAVLTQLSFVAGVLLLVHLELTLLRQSAPIALRVLSVPVTAIFCTLLVNAAVGELAAGALLLMGMLSAVLVVASGASRILSTRAAETTSLFLIAAGVATALALTARAFVLQDAHSLVTLGLWAASAAWIARAALTLLAIALLTKASPRPRWPPSICLATAGVLAWFSAGNAAANEPAWQVLAARALGNLQQTSVPWLTPAPMALEHTLALGTALWAALFHRGLPVVHRTVLALCLLALRTPDAPLLALALFLAALLASTAPPPQVAKEAGASDELDSRTQPDDLDRGELSPNDQPSLAPEGPRTHRTT